MSKITLLDHAMFCDESDISCYNVLVGTESGTQVWDWEAFYKRFPRLAYAVLSNYVSGVLSADYKGIVSISLI